jgi:Fe2+ transport system protein FeoA
VTILAGQDIDLPEGGRIKVSPKPATRRMVRLTELAAGESGRVVRVETADVGCRRRFAELGLAEGMTVKVQSAGETLMIALGCGRMALAGRCACEVWVLRHSAEAR